MATPAADPPTSTLTSSPSKKSPSPTTAPSSLLAFLPLELQHQITRTVTTADTILLRLSRLFTSTASVEAILAPLQYTACLLSYLQRDVHARSASTAAALDAVVGSWRNTLRLLQVPLLYAVLRELLLRPGGAAGGDVLIWRINVAQCVVYLVYQVLENVAHLIDLGVLSSASVPIALYRTQSTLWLHSNRFWLAGITCDLLRLAREAQLERAERRGSNSDVGGKKKDQQKISAEREEVEAKWWHELQMAGFTWPLCLHWSLEKGLSRFNDGVIGTLGVLASYKTLQFRWEETKVG